MTTGLFERPSIAAFCTPRTPLTRWGRSAKRPSRSPSPRRKECLVRLVKDLVKLGAKTDKVRGPREAEAHPDRLRDARLTRQTHRSRPRPSARRARWRSRTPTRALTRAPSLETPTRLDRRASSRTAQGIRRRARVGRGTTPRGTTGARPHFERSPRSTKDAACAEPLARRHLAWCAVPRGGTPWRARGRRTSPGRGAVARVRGRSSPASTRRDPASFPTRARLPSHLPGWARSPKQRPPRWCQGNGLEPIMLGVDCEMCETDVARAGGRLRG